MSNYNSVCQYKHTLEFDQRHKRSNRDAQRHVHEPLLRDVPREVHIEVLTINVYHGVDHGGHDVVLNVVQCKGLNKDCKAEKKIEKNRFENLYKKRIFERYTKVIKELE